MMETGKGLRNIDPIILMICILLIGTGLMNIFSSEYSGQQVQMFDLSTNFWKQMLWVGVSMLLFFIIFLIDARFYMNISWGLYIGAVGLLMLTLVLGKEIAGSKSWISLGFFNLQTSEFAKFATALALAKFFDRQNVDLRNIRHTIFAFAIIGFPMILIILQNDFGSALVFVAFILVLFRQGLSPLFLVIPFIGAILFLAALLVNIYWLLAVLVVIGIIVILQASAKSRAIFLVIMSIGLSVGIIFSVDYVFNNVLQPHQQSRINVLLGKEIDLRGAGYNVHQSLIAIGSGGTTGKGYLKGTQTKFDFIPEQSTDFIFCTVAEEWGFLGSLFLILLYFGLFWQILKRSEKQKFRFVRIYGYGIMSVMFLHVAVNMGMTLGLFPVIGIPLPFISYGGSSLFGFAIMIALFLNFDSKFKHYFN